MRKVEIKYKNKIILENIKGFLRKKVTKFGNGAKVDCPKEYLGSEVVLAILDGKK